MLDFELGLVPDGYRVNGPAHGDIESIIVRRLSEHGYWIDCGGYQSTLVVGEESGLLVDPLSGNRGVHIREAVRKLFSREISTIAYSHRHGDHIADATALERDRATTSQSLGILAGEICSRRVTLEGRYPAPTRVLADGEMIDFEGIRIEAKVIGGHTEDLTWFRLVDEGVLHLVDTVHPAQAEFESFGMAIDLGDYRRALEAARSSDWRVMTAGHGQIGWPGDIDVVLEYLNDLSSVVSESILANPPGAFTDISRHRYAWFSARLVQVQNDSVAALRPRWGELPGFDQACPSHVHRMFLQLAYFE
jgi:glyoxylase-like metal-dependent hydrolase (beta-lactamase superfamily II)